MKRRSINGSLKIKSLGAFLVRTLKRAPERVDTESSNFGYVVGLNRKEVKR